jgi:hypothetical protein
MITSMLFRTFSRLVTRFKRLPWRAKFRRQFFLQLTDGFGHAWLGGAVRGLFRSGSTAANRLVPNRIGEGSSNLAQGEGHDGELCKEELTQRLPPKSVMTPKQSAISGNLRIFTRSGQQIHLKCGMVPEVLH